MQKACWNTNFYYHTYQTNLKNKHYQTAKNRDNTFTIRMSYSFKFAKIVKPKRKII